MILDKIFFQTTVKNVAWLGASNPYFQHCILDSRSVGVQEKNQQSCFFALQGSRVDGHDFIKNVYDAGVRTFVVAREKESKICAMLGDSIAHCSIALVDNVGNALVDVAAAWRSQFTIPVIGITGSVGKTSTKEMLVSLLRLSGKKCLATEGNSNTLVSVACTLLTLRSEHEYAVIEMGVNKRGEMAVLANLVRPTMALITCIAHSHTEGLGSLNDIALEKRAIFKYFSEGNIGIINGDQPLLASISYPHPVVKFGFKTTNQVQARKVQVHGHMTSCTLKLYGTSFPLTLQTIHVGRVLNALACSAAAYLLNIPYETIVKGIVQAEIVPGRFELKSLPSHKGVVINDCYNANPESMKAALLAFERMETRGKKIAILGDMLELGVNTPFWHRQLSRTLRKLPSITRVIFVGKHVKAAEKTMPHTIPFTSVENWQEALNEFNACIQRDYQHDEIAVLVKASNGMGLKNLVEHIVGI